MRSECRAFLWALVLSACAFSVHADEKRATLPDWSGWWALDKPFNDELAQTPPPMKPADWARFRDVRRDDSDPDPVRYCRPPQFVGYSGGFVEAIEFLFTPGRVTLTTEQGLLRRIYTDGTPLPTTSADATNTGFSVGHWEGQTLVVETVAINPEARYPVPTQGAMPIGKHARITERISLRDANTLRFEVVTVAPDIFVKPDKRVRYYTRVRNKTTAHEITFCAEHDRSIDPTTGKQRFDMTPPAGLPPPPPRSN